MCRVAARHGGHVRQREKETQVLIKINGSVLHY